jgi:hypothetical protein
MVTIIEPSPTAKVETHQEGESEESTTRHLDECTRHRALAEPRLETTCGPSAAVKCIEAGLLYLGSPTIDC